MENVLQTTNVIKKVGKGVNQLHRWYLKVKNSLSYARNSEKVLPATYAIIRKLKSSYLLQRWYLKVRKGLLI
jgi:hypothetical protein